MTIYNFTIVFSLQSKSKCSCIQARIQGGSLKKGVVLKNRRFVDDRYNDDPS